MGLYSLCYLIILSLSNPALHWVAREAHPLISGPEGTDKAPPSYHQSLLMVTLSVDSSILYVTGESRVSCFSCFLFLVYFLDDIVIKLLSALSVLIFRQKCRFLLKRPSGLLHFFLRKVRSSAYQGILILQHIEIIMQSTVSQNAFYVIWILEFNSQKFTNWYKWQKTNATALPFASTG